MRRWRSVTAVLVSVLVVTFLLLGVPAVPASHVVQVSASVDDVHMDSSLEVVMAGEGDTRRPQLLSDREMGASWARTFGAEPGGRVARDAQRVLGMWVVADDSVPRDEVRFVSGTQVGRLVALDHNSTRRAPVARTRARNGMREKVK